MHPLVQGYVEGCKPPFTGDPISWLETHFKIPFSARSKRFHRNNAPHLNDIIRTAVDLPHKKVVVRACTGAGKTTVLEAISIFVVGVEHGPMLIVGQTDKDIKDWSEADIPRRSTLARKFRSICRKIGTNGEIPRFCGVIWRNSSLVRTFRDSRRSPCAIAMATSAGFGNEG